MIGIGVSYTMGLFAADGTIDDLLGPFDVKGGSASAARYTIGGDYATGGDTDVWDIAGGLTSPGTPVEFHWGETTTSILFEDPNLLHSPSLWPIWTAVDTLLVLQGFF
jgi:hypothetical protein